MFIMVNMNTKQRGIRWAAIELDRLYNLEGNTLQGIGNKFGVSRERIRQVMQMLNVKYTRKRIYNGANTYKTIEEYFAKPRTRDNHNTLIRLIPKSTCSDCGMELNHRLHLHHIRYPALSLDDILILCPSCHHVKHRSGISYRKQVNLFNRYEDGERVASLALEHSVSTITVYKIIDKIRSGRNTIRKQH